jgi:hypothetical protein
MGFNPLVMDVRPRAGISGEHLTLTYHRSKEVPPMVFVADYSTNLVDWLTGPAYVMETDRVDLGEAERVTVRSVMPLAEQPGAYLRLRVQP